MTQRCRRGVRLHGEQPMRDREPAASAVEERMNRRLSMVSPRTRVHRIIGCGRLASSNIPEMLHACLDAPFIRGRWHRRRDRIRTARVRNRGREVRLIAMRSSSTALAASGFIGPPGRPRCRTLSSRTSAISGLTCVHTTILPVGIDAARYRFHGDRARHRREEREIDRHPDVLVRVRMVADITAAKKNARTGSSMAYRTPSPSNRSRRLDELYRLGHSRRPADL